MSAKQAINDKLQGSVATYLTYGGLLLTKLRRYIVECVSEFFFKSVNIWQERGCLMHFARLAS